MLQSKLFTKTKKEIPTDETSKNAQLLLRAGFIHKEMAGVYSWLPLGLLVLNKIREIISQEMQALGSTEIIMSSLQNKETWLQTKRWDDEKVNIWFKSKLHNDQEIGFGWSHEEPIVEMLKNCVNSYKDFPIVVHQFQNKFRNEVRAKSGVMRGREFLMKDMYSFFSSQEALDKFYNQTIEAYKNVFEKVGLGQITYVTSAAGGVFTEKFSHEFQTVCEVGEDNIYIHKNKFPDNQSIAINQEIFTEETLNQMNLQKAEMENFELKKSVEVGNIFNFGKQKCEEMNLNFTDIDGKKNSVYLGSYGIGLTRLVGVIAEVLSDEKGLVWPNSVAPFSLHLISLAKNSEEESYKKAQEIYQKLTDHKVEILWDNRLDKSVGEKLNEADLIGIPLRVIISEKSLAAGGVEIKERKSQSKDGEIISIDQLWHMHLEQC